MRTTLDLEDDILLAAKDLAKRQRRSAGAVISELARLGLRMSMQNREQSSRIEEPAALYGFEPIAANGKLVSTATVDTLRDELGV